jgi:hypothetical protein
VKIECKLKREGGTTVEMRDGTKIKFKPDATGAHVAEVTNPKHVQALLAVSEGYRIFGVDDDEPDDVVEPVQSTQGQSDDQTGGEGGQDANDGAGGSDDEGDQGQTADIPLEHMTETDLRALFEREIGKKPHHAAGMASMIKAIETHRAEQA